MSRESGRVMEGAAIRESGRATEAPENSVSGWEAIKNGSGSRHGDVIGNGEGLSGRVAVESEENGVSH
jgi:hypothetical protein